MPQRQHSATTPRHMRRLSRSSSAKVQHHRLLLNQWQSSRSRIRCHNIQVLPGSSETQILTSSHYAIYSCHYITLFHVFCQVAAAFHLLKQLHAIQTVAPCAGQRSADHASMGQSNCPNMHCLIVSEIGFCSL